MTSPDMIAKLAYELEAWLYSGRSANECAKHLLSLGWTLHEWSDISKAKQDGTRYLMWSEDVRNVGLPPFMSVCAWHPEAGFCTDELREPTKFMELPSPPQTEKPC